MGVSELETSNMKPETFAIGIDLGGSSVKGVLVSADGRLILERNQTFDPERRLAFAETVRNVVASLEAAHGCGVDAVGLSAPGLPAKDETSISYLPNRLDGIEGLNWRQFLDRSNPVPVMNDAQAALLGEVWQGAARGLTNVIMLTLGTGVGGAAMVEGRLLRGRSGKAGHLGHVSLDLNGAPDICGTPGSLELMIGNCTIAERTLGRYATTHNLIRAHEAGEPSATDVWMKSVKALACAVVSFTNVLDPEVVVIGGGIARAGDVLFQPLREFVSSMEWKVCGNEVQIVPAELGELAGAWGAAIRALTGR